MKRFKTLCIDKKTGKEMVLEDCSYNNACWWIDNAAKVNNFRVLGTEKSGDLIVVNCTAGITFYYDEPRGFLLKD